MCSEGAVQETAWESDAIWKRGRQRRGEVRGVGWVPGAAQIRPISAENMGSSTPSGANKSSAAISNPPKDAIEIPRLQAPAAA